jgi:hypothetical protein
VWPLTSLNTHMNEGAGTYGRSKFRTVDRQETLSISVAPGRVAYLILAGSRADLVRAISAATARWAGAHEPILEVTSEGKVTAASLRVTSTSQVWSVVALGVPQTQAQDVARQLGLPLQHHGRVSVVGRAPHGSVNSVSIAARGGPPSSRGLTATYGSMWRLVSWKTKATNSCLGSAQEFHVPEPRTRVDAYSLNSQVS